MSSGVSIDLRGLSKRFGAVQALRGVDITIEAGSTTVLIGPSGCGKSTLLRMIVGLTWPDAGRVDVDGQPVTPDNVQRVRRRLGYVIQEGGLFPHLTAWENVALMARQLGWSRDAERDRVETLANLVRLPVATLARFPIQLSGGQRQRVSLMRALMLDPAALLMDEPLGALDPMIRAELQDELRTIFRRLGKTVVLVTHDLAEAGFFGDRIALLCDGEIAQQGPLGDLIDAPASPFVEAFVNAQRTTLERESSG